YDGRSTYYIATCTHRGYAEAIVVPPILAEQFELKHSLINMMTSDQFFRLEKDNPHDHINLLYACPHHGFTELHQLDNFYNALNLADQDSLNSVAGGNLLERRTQDVLTIIKNKSKVHNSRNKSIVSQVKSSDANCSSSSEIAKLTHAVNQQTSAVTTAMNAILKQFQTTPPPASVKAVEEICVTCGGAHPYYQCLAADGNTFPEYQDNIQGYVSAAAVNYNQGNSGYRPPGVANQIRPPGFAQPNRSLPSSTIANPKGELKAITTQSGIVLDGPSVPMPPPFINPEEDERVEETLTDPNLADTIANPKGELKAITTQSGIVLDGPSIPMPPPFINPEEDERVEETLTYPNLAEYTIIIPPPLKMLKSLLFNKEKLLELANTPLNENCSAVILKKLPEKLGDPGKFLIPFGFIELKCKALADLGSSINLMPLSVWKKLGLSELIFTRMTLKLANWAICTPTGIARYVFVPVGKFTFPADFVIVDYESDLRVPLILGRPFLQSARALIDVHGEEMILRDDLFATNHLSGNPTFSSYTDLTSPEVKDDIFDLEVGIVLIEKLINLDSTKEIRPPHNINPSTGSTTSSSPDHLLEEFADELALITFSPGNDDLPFNIESDLKEIEYLLNYDPTKEMDSTLEDSVDKENLTDLNDNLFDTIPEMFTDEHTLDYSSPPLYDEYDDDLDEFESDTDDAYNDPFDSKEEKINESKLLIDKLNLPGLSDFLPSLEYDSFLFEDFSEVDALPSTNNEDNIATSHASLILEDFDLPLYELPFHKEVPKSETLLSFSSENKEKVFKPRILTSKGVHSSLLLELSHRDPKTIKVIKIFESPMEIFPCSYGEDIRILDVPFPFLSP
nr:hypothetical protein [Tanacetum cinerariifolium]